MGAEDGAEKRSFESEEALYEFIGLQWVPPELREGDGEIEAALSRKLPKLVFCGGYTGRSSWPHDLE